MIRFITLVLMVLSAGGVLGFVTACAPEYLPMLFSVSLFVVGVMMFYGINQTINKGKLQGRVGITSRHAAPVTFWFGIFVYALAGIFCFIMSGKLIVIFLHCYHVAQ